MKRRRKRTTAEKILIRIEFLLVTIMIYAMTNIAVDKVLTYLERYLGIIWGESMGKLIANALASIIAIAYTIFYISLIAIPTLIIINR